MSTRLATNNNLVAYLSIRLVRLCFSEAFCPICRLPREPASIVGAGAVMKETVERHQAELITSEKESMRIMISVDPI